MMCYDFDRQRPIGNYIVDFYFKELRLALEVDGITHQEEKLIWKDKARQKELENLGINFLRFDALLVVNKVEAAVKEIKRWIEAYEQKNGVSEIVRRKGLLRITHPRPSKEGMHPHSPDFSPKLYML